MNEPIEQEQGVSDAPEHPDNIDTVEVNDDLEPEHLTEPTQEELDSVEDAPVEVVQDDEDPRADVPGDVL